MGNLFYVYNPQVLIYKKEHFHAFLKIGLKLLGFFQAYILLLPEVKMQT